MIIILWDTFSLNGRLYPVQYTLSVANRLGLRCRRDLFEMFIQTVGQTTLELVQLANVTYHFWKFIFVSCSRRNFVPSVVDSVKKRLEQVNETSHKQKFKKI